MKDSEYIKSLVIEGEKAPLIKAHNERLLAIAKKLANLERVKKHG
jgi:hypothetical protein